MHLIVEDWLHYLMNGQRALGATLVVGGCCLLLTGWRFARVALVTIYAMIGVGGGLAIGRADSEDMVYGAIGGLLLAGVGIVSGRFSAAILAGGLGVLTLRAVLESSTVPQATIYIILVLTFAAIVALSALDRRVVTILLTSFVGSALLVSGVTAMAAGSHGVAPHLRALSGYRLFYPFLLLVSTVCGVMLQNAGVRRQDSGERL